MRFGLIDAANLFNRAHHVCSGDAYEKAAASMHLIFQSLAYLQRTHSIDHMVICGDDGSWRREVYPMYKESRRKLRESLLPKEREENEVFFEVIGDFMNFMAENTRCTVVKINRAEADDIIARFIHLHPDDDHIIISGDSDMIQLVSENVSIYNGVTHHLVTKDGVFDQKGQSLVFSVKPASGKLQIGKTKEETIKHAKLEIKTLIKKQQLSEAKLSDAIRKAKVEFEEVCVDKKLEKKEEITKLEKELNKCKLEILKLKNKEIDEDCSPPKDWVQLALFVKCIRGDKGDFIFSAYPGVRYNGTANKVGIYEAWQDRDNKGFPWNNFMLQTWNKLLPNGDTKDVTVLEEYNANKELIDLTMQPSAIKELIDNGIVTAIQKEAVGNVGIKFLQFCAKYDLVRAQERVNDHIKYLNKGYFQ